MPKEVELEGSPAEATWAMIVVIVVVIVVLIFCCLVPFYRALEKRYHHWEDTEHDPRWDQDQFQFSPTSPRLQRSNSQRSGDQNYNRLSVCTGGEDESSVTTSNSNINNSFRNNCVLPRLSDQVEFKLPKKFDDGFNIAVINESVTEEDEVAPSPQKKLQNMPTLDKSSAAGAGANKKAGKFQKKTLNPSPLTLTPQDKRVEEDERKVEAEKTASTKQATSPAATTASKQDILNKRIEEQRQKQLERQAQTNKNKATLSVPSNNPPSSAPGAPSAPKRNSKLMSPAGDRKIVNGVTAPVVNGNDATPTVSPPARRSYKKVKKPVPDPEAV